MKSLNTPKNLKVLRRISLLSIIILMLATVFTVPLMAEKNSEEIIFSKKYVRKEGPVSTVEDEFSVDIPGDDFLLHIQNGEDKKHRVSSAVISINGKQVVGPDEFNQQVGLIEKNITLKEDNVIAVKVTSAPGSFIIVNIIQKVLNHPPVITSTPITTGTEGLLYEYDVEATDADNDQLTFSLLTFPKKSDVIIRIYHQNGQPIRTLNLGSKNAGIYLTKEKAAYWDGRDSLGEKVASGVYFYTLQVGAFSATQKMVILK